MHSEFLSVLRPRVPRPRGGLEELWSNVTRKDGSCSSGANVMSMEVSLPLPPPLDEVSLQRW